MNRLVPISIEALPIELLTRIFQIAYHGEHCLAPHDHNFDDPPPWVKFPKQPDTLAHVCSTWRRTALATSSLWSHIDIAINHRRNHNFFSRAKVYVQRAAHRPLEVHIYDGTWRREPRNRAVSGQRYPNAYEFECLDAGVVSIRSLMLDIRMGSPGPHLAILGYFLAKCAKGALVHYVTRVISPGTNGFLETAEELQSPRTDSLQIPKSELEEQWRSVKVVHVTGLCPRWSSELYHGLVDLRLGREIPRVAELQLISVFKASPGLRIVHLKSRIIFNAPKDAEVTRIPLNDLEVLNIGKDQRMCRRPTYGRIVRWLQPGVKPLQFTFCGVLNHSTVEFIERSNVKRFYCQGRRPPTSADLLCMAPRLQTLVIEVCDFGVKSIETILYPINEGDPTLHIETMYLSGFKKLALGHIQEAVDRYSIQRLFLHSCRLAYPLGARMEVCEYRDVTKMREKLSEIRNCPVVEYLTCYELELDNWE
ncbi:unnamed protein product [Rhizoctonia solani]|uniref:F-box domain-containing protein n=1 Tax=Rhizoctonia solani TaxID=456999 RepID=A0A8H2WAF6_9AGAM|nr:unnamed protein product [Rhizoctonia solani]